MSEDERRRSFRPVEGAVAAIEWGDPARDIDVLWLHANGFNASTYRSILSPLGDRLRVLAVDLRGHGRSTLPAVPSWRRNWSDLRDDLVALLDQLGAPPLVLAGHSMGGTISLLAAARRPHAVKALALFDPVIMARPVALYAQRPRATKPMWRRTPLVRSTLRRRAVFDTPELALAAYRGRGAFRTWSDAVLADYLDDGLRKRPDGGVELACDPAWEASNFAAQGADPWRALPSRARTDPPPARRARLYLPHRHGRRFRPARPARHPGDDRRRQPLLADGASGACPRDPARAWRPLIEGRAATCARVELVGLRRCAGLLETASMDAVWSSISSNWPALAYRASPSTMRGCMAA
jgi:pimeloyl-ACP methyl ester carboxylesterase